MKSTLQQTVSLVVPSRDIEKVRLIEKKQREAVSQ
jgi:hypothetical protein